MQGADFDINVVEHHILEEAKNHARDANEADVLPHLQHFGGNTNLIDFTTDYLIALFFACDGANHDEGRLILLDKRKAAEDSFEFQYPVSPLNRVLAQKSVFVKSPTGYIEIDPDCTITIPAFLKTPILNYLRTQHAISTETIYNDLHGFIRVEQLHHHSYAAFVRGVRCYHQRDSEAAIAQFTEALRRHPQFSKAHNNLGMIYKDQEQHDRAFLSFDAAIAMNPGLAEAYNNRGAMYNKQGNPVLAIQDFTNAIGCDPSRSEPYFNRGRAFFQTREFIPALSDLDNALRITPGDSEYYFYRAMMRVPFNDVSGAKTDLTAATMLGRDIVSTFRNTYRSISHFQNSLGLHFPEEIAAMLGCTQSPT